VRSRISVVLSLLGVVLLLDGSAATAKGSSVFVLRRVYVPGETAVAYVGGWVRPSATGWVIVMDPDPLWFARRPHPAPAAAPTSMSERRGGERYLSWIVPTLPFGRYDVRLCPAPCGPGDRRFETGETMLVADDRSDAPLMRRIEGLLVERIESRRDQRAAIASLRRTAHMLRVTRATAHAVADHEAELAEELAAEVSAVAARSEAQRGSGTARLLAAFGSGIAAALGAVALVGRRSRRIRRSS
jgi:hypothetical protein